MKQGRLKDILKLILFLSIGILVVWWFVKDLSAEQLQQIRQAFQDADYAWVGIALVLGVLSFVFRTLRWQMQIQSMGYRVRRRNVLAAVMLGYLANLGIPRLGEVLRCGALVQTDQVPFTKAIGTVITERIIDMLCFGLIVLLTIALESARIHDYALTNFSKLWLMMANPQLWGFLLALLLLAILSVWIFRRLLARRMAQNRLYQALIKILRNIGEGLLSLRQMPRPGLFLFYTFGLWFCYYAMAYLVFFSMEATAGLPLGAGLSCLCFGTVGVMVTPGGLGLYPVIIAETLAIYGIDTTIGFALGWLIWGAQNITIILGGLLATVYISQQRRKNA